jgi:hypothetical protein
MSDETRHWGLAGLGRHGNLSADLDEPLDREGSWKLELSGFRWGVTFDVPGPDTVRALLAFVREHGQAPGYAQHIIHKSETHEVLLVKNSDLGVRLALLIHGKNSTSSATIQDDDVASFQKVLEDVVEDLDT